jgi:hypothetical protein
LKKIVKIKAEASRVGGVTLERRVREARSDGKATGISCSAIFTLSLSQSDSHEWKELGRNNPAGFILNP